MRGYVEPCLVIYKNDGIGCRPTVHFVLLFWAENDEEKIYVVRLKQ